MNRVIALLLMAVLLSGCSGVMMNAEYSNLLDQTVAMSDAAAVRAKAGTLDNESMIRCLELQALTWRRFQDARDGEK